MTVAHIGQRRKSHGIVRGLGRSTRFYMDLVRGLGTFGRVLLAAKDRPIAFGFFVNRGDALLGAAVCPDATFVRVNYPRRKYGWDAAAFRWLLNALVRLTGDRPSTAIIWGYRDRTNHDVDVGYHFPKHYRVERGLVRTRGLAFIIGAKSIYFDGRVSTECEDRLNALTPGDLPKCDVGRRLLRHVLEANLTKYALDDRKSADVSERDLLIVGQCTGDQAIAQTDALVRTNPELLDLVAERLVASGRYGRVYYKPHPKNGTNRADLAHLREHHPDITVIGEGTSVVPLLARKPTVATLTSGVGLEAAIRGCEVHCFGVSFYSHWGFTVDHLPCPRRVNRLSAEDVLLSMLMEQTRYVDNAGRHISPVEAFGLAQPQNTVVAAAEAVG